MANEGDPIQALFYRMEEVMVGRMWLRVNEGRRLESMYIGTYAIFWRDKER